MLTIDPWKTKNGGQLTGDGQLWKRPPDAFWLVIKKYGVEMNEQTQNTLIASQLVRDLTDSEVSMVDGGLAIFGIVFPMMHAGSRTQGEVTNLSDIAAP